MLTLIIRDYTGPIFDGGTEFGWRENEDGPIAWFNSTGNGDAYIQANLQEYRQVCGFEFEVEDQRKAGQSITTEPCPTCRAPAACRHLSGTHVWDCLNCGEIIAAVCYDCPDCAVGQTIESAGARRNEPMKCIQRYGKPPRDCHTPAKYYYRNPQTKELEGPYCGRHAQQFAPEGLRPIEAYPELTAKENE